MDVRGIDKAISKDIKQRQRALAVGALVLPPQNLQELELQELANADEIEMLCERRSVGWSRLSSSTLTERDRRDIAYDVRRAGESLRVAFAARQRLRVAATLI